MTLQGKSPRKIYIIIITIVIIIITIIIIIIIIIINVNININIINASININMINVNIKLIIISSIIVIIVIIIIIIIIVIIIIIIIISSSSSSSSSISTADLIPTHLLFPLRSWPASFRSTRLRVSSCCRFVEPPQFPREPSYICCSLRVFEFNLAAPCLNTLSAHARDCDASFPYYGQSAN